MAKEKRSLNNFQKIHQTKMNEGKLKFNQVVKATGKNPSTIYDWMKFPEKIDLANRILIASIYQVPLQDIFPGTEIMQLDAFDYQDPPDPVKIPQQKIKYLKPYLKNLPM